MKERSYTVAEIDRMRRAIEWKYLHGGGKISDPIPEGGITSRVYDETEKTKCVEEQLRTYMLAGVDPKELE